MEDQSLRTMAVGVEATRTRYQVQRMDGHGRGFPTSLLVSHLVVATPMAKEPPLGPFASHCG